MQEVVKNVYIAFRTYYTIFVHFSVFIHLFIFVSASDERKCFVLVRTRIFNRRNRNNPDF